jgi:hypothetical protein
LTRFDDAIGAIAIYRSLYPQDTLEGGGYAWALGRRPSDADAADLWDRTVEQLRGAAVPAAMRVLEQHGITGEEWTVDRVELLLDGGTLGETVRDALRLRAARPIEPGVRTLIR